MYDFYLGQRPEGFQNEVNYLLSIKRLLPRWVNSIPDMQFATMAKVLHNLGNQCEKNGEKLCLVETGVGASTIAFIYYAMKHHGIAFTWDFNTQKGSEIRTACTETMCNSFDANINSFWKLVGYKSTSPELGIPILKEWISRVHFSFHDSEHTWENISKELHAVDPFLSDGSVVAVDDAYYDFLHTDTAYINILRKKLDLVPIEISQGNSSQPHFVEFEKFLRARWVTLVSVSDEYKRLCREDVSIAYFGNELQLRSNLGMEQVQRLETRFAAWEVRGRKQI